MQGGGEGRGPRDKGQVSGTKCQKSGVQRADDMRPTKSFCRKATILTTDY